MAALIERRTAIVTIYPGTYLQDIRHLEQLAEAAKNAQGPIPLDLSETPEYLELARQHDDLVREAESKATHFKLQALGRQAWRSLCAEHPPRKGEDVDKTVAQQDAAVGVNEDTFKDPLVLLSVIEPAGLTVEDLDNLSDVDFDRLYLTAFALNRSMVPDPKASLVSRMTPTTDETSN